MTKHIGGGQKREHVFFNTGQVVLVNGASELTYLATDTKTPYTYHFDCSDGGKPAYYWLRWENAGGQVGPWSDEVMATIWGSELL